MLLIPVGVPFGLGQHLRWCCCRWGRRSACLRASAGATSATGAGPGGARGGRRCCCRCLRCCPVRGAVPAGRQARGEEQRGALSTVRTWTTPPPGRCRPAAAAGTHPAEAARSSWVVAARLHGPMGAQVYRVDGVMYSRCSSVRTSVTWGQPKCGYIWQSSQGRQASWLAARHGAGRQAHGQIGRQAGARADRKACSSIQRVPTHQK